MNFSQKEAIVLNYIQKGIPCSEKPFDIIAQETGLKKADVIDIIKSLKESKIIRNISGIFDGEKLGYYLSLVAFKIPEEKIEKAKDVINSHPGVSHNYLRNHEYNIWFTLAEDTETDFNRSVRIIASKAEAEDYLILRNERLLKIGVFLDIAQSDDTYIYKTTEQHTKKFLDEKEKEAVRLLQIDMPITEAPFDEIIEQSSLINSPHELLKYFTDFLESGTMRRYAAVLKHQKAGFTSNAMTAWKPSANFNEEIFRNCSSISHLYYRTLYPGKWEYPLFAMIHAKSKEELQGIIKKLSVESGIKDYLVLESLKEFKKSRVRYFDKNFEEWKRLNYD